MIRKSDVASLYEEIKALDADEEDDKAMGDVAPEKLATNEEVSSLPPTRFLIIVWATSTNGSAPNEYDLASTPSAHTDRYTILCRSER